jgi:hypothetical protein
MLLASEGATSVHVCVRCRGKCRVDWDAEVVRRLGAAYPVICPDADPRLLSLLPVLPVAALST